jgi:hypothetical protein
VRLAPEHGLPAKSGALPGHDAAGQLACPSFSLRHGSIGRFPSVTGPSCAAGEDQVKSAKYVLPAGVRSTLAVRTASVSAWCGIQSNCAQFKRTTSSAPMRPASIGLLPRKYRSVRRRDPIAVAVPFRLFWRPPVGGHRLGPHRPPLGGRQQPGGGRVHRGHVGGSRRRTVMAP